MGGDAFLPPHLGWCCFLPRAAWPPSSTMWCCSSPSVFGWCCFFPSSVKVVVLHSSALFGVVVRSLRLRLGGVASLSPPFWAALPSATSHVGPAVAFFFWVLLSSPPSFFGGAGTLLMLLLGGGAFSSSPFSGGSACFRSPGCVVLLRLHLFFCIVMLSRKRRCRNSIVLRTR